MPEGLDERGIRDPGERICYRRHINRVEVQRTEADLSSRLGSYMIDKAIKTGAETNRLGQRTGQGVDGVSNREHRNDTGQYQGVKTRNAGLSRVWWLPQEEPGIYSAPPRCNNFPCFTAMHYFMQDFHIKPHMLTTVVVERFERGDISSIIVPQRTISFN